MRALTERRSLDSKNWRCWRARTCTCCDRAQSKSTDPVGEQQAAWCRASVSAGVGRTEPGSDGAFGESGRAVIQANVARWRMK